MTPFDRTIHITQKTVVTNLWCTLEWHPSVKEGESGRFINHVPNMGKLIMKHRQEGTIVSIHAFLFNISCAQELSWIECYILATCCQEHQGWVNRSQEDRPTTVMRKSPPPFCLWLKVLCLLIKSWILPIFFSASLTLYVLFYQRLHIFIDYFIFNVQEYYDLTMIINRILMLKVGSLNS